MYGSFDISLSLDSHTVQTSVFIIKTLLSVHLEQQLRVHNEI